MDRCELWPESGCVLLAVSGGIDSMALAYMMNQLWARQHLGAPKILHLNHALRTESDGEELMVCRWAQAQDIAFYSHKVKHDQQKNLEHWGRTQRYQFFQSHLRPGDRLATGHHINDSWEWSLMQSFRSGDFHKSLGIPVRRGPYIRPLMAFSRAQLQYFVEQLAIPFMHDASNDLQRFERNFVRSQITGAVTHRYPGALAHYVHQKNDLARLLGKSAFSLSPTTHRWYVQRAQGQWLLFASDQRKNLQGAQRLLQQGIHELSAVSRGRIKGEIEKICTKSRHFQGPHSFSGGVKLIREGHTFRLYKERSAG